MLRSTSRLCPLAWPAVLAVLATLIASPAAALKPERVQFSDPVAGPHLPVPAPDDRNDVVLLGGNPLSVRVLGDDLVLGEPRILGLAPETLGLRPLRAARNELGDWLIAAANRLYWLRGGDQERLPTPPNARVWDVAFFDGSPVVAISFAGEPAPDAVPLVLRWSGSRWETLVEKPLSRANPTGVAATGRRTEETAAVLHVASDRTLWIGLLYRHRLLQVGSRGSVLREVHLRPAVSDALNGARRGIDDLAEGPDGTLYVLRVSSGDGSPRALERLDPHTGTLSRLPIDLAAPGPMRMVGSPGGLLLVADRAAPGAWLLSWEALEAASWWAEPSTALLAPPSLAPIH